MLVIVIVIVRMVVIVRMIVIVGMIVVVTRMRMLVRVPVRMRVNDRAARHVALRRSMRATATAAPKPLSMLTTVTPEAQLVSMPSKAVSPENAVP
jgi:hypothetical protein